MDLVYTQRAAECRAACLAVREGFTAAVPEGLLALFSWAQLRAACCVAPHVDVDLLVDLAVCAPGVGGARGIVM